MSKKELKALIDEAQPKFLSIAKQNNLPLSFEAECGFALQLLNSNKQLFDAAMANPSSLQNAVINVASVGLSLNPARKQAYLIVRTIKSKDENGRDKYKKTVCLDPSYMGFCDLATQSGMIEWVQAKVVYKNDVYKNLGIDKEPLHEYDAFEDRGEIKGFYCVAKISGEDKYLTTEMPKAKIDEVMERSESVKYARQNNQPIFGPWKTDYEEMGKKTVIRNAYKTWPKAKESQQFANAVHISNENEGFTPIETTPSLGNFSVDQKEYFDQCIESNDAMAMYVMQQSIGESLFQNLYHSFPRGVKGRYQKIIDELLVKGKITFEGFLQDFVDAIHSGDDLAVFQLESDVSHDALKVMIDCLGPEELQCYEQINRSS